MRLLHPGGDAGVHHCHESLGLGQAVKEKGVLGEEGNVHGGPTRLQDGLKGPVSHVPRYGPHTKILVLHGLADGPGIGQVHPDGGDAGHALHGFQGDGGAVHDGDFELLVPGQVLSDCPAHPAGAKYGYLHFDPTFVREL
jgi:hypothetical protein